MKIYLISATAVIFLSVIISLVIPDGKLNKTILFVMRMACIFVLIQPLVGIFKINITTAGAPICDYEYITEVYSRHQSEQLKKVIAEKFNIDSVCSVTIDYKNGEFKADSVKVEISKKNRLLIDDICEYLRELNYINISVYAKSD